MSAEPTWTRCQALDIDTHRPIAVPFCCVFHRGKQIDWQKTNAPWSPNAGRVTVLEVWGDDSGVPQIGLCRLGVGRER